MWKVLLLLLFLPSMALAAQPQPVSIGVLSHRGDEVTRAMWSETADYLSMEMPEYEFAIVPLNFDAVEPAVAGGQVDFILVNPGMYVNLEVWHRVSRIATLKNRRGGLGYNIFGGVIFTRADRTDIRTMADLVDKRFMAVDERSLGGFQMAWREMHRAGIEPYEDFAELRFGGTHDRVVRAVLAGEMDAGTVRTDILERMAISGDIELGSVFIINQQRDADFPFALSTELYPEWPFSKLQHTPNRLAQQVAVALLNMPEDHPAAQAGRYSGWTIPLDYQPVHDLFKELQLPPYSPQPISLVAVIRYYGHWLLAGAGALLLMSFMSTWVWRLNRQLEKAKSCLEQQHQLILNSVADGIYGVDTRGNSTFVNAAMEKITGWSADELIGINQHEALHHTHADGSPHPPFECPVYQTFRDNQARYVEDDIFWRKDGSSFAVEYTSNPVHDARGVVIGAVVVFRDITERKQAQERIRNHQLELAHVSRLSTMGEMASGIAHEINQPLSAVANYARGCINMLRNRSGDEAEVLDGLERIAGQAERAGEIIRQLRAFVRKEELARSVVDVNRRVQDLAVLLAPDVHREGVRLELQLDECPPCIYGHGIQIEQVILNLARNAVEAMTEVPRTRRHLAIATEVRDDAIEVRVCDTGPGISSEVAGKLFDPFVTTKPKGMGLGLSISRGIIEAHGGHLVVASSSVGGTEFRFTLPRYQEE